MLAGAVALSAATGSWLGGALLGGVYVFGLISPLLPLAFAYSRLRGRVRDPQLSLRLGTRVKPITLSRLAGTVLFAAFGVLFIVLAVSGNAESAPGFQRTLGLWVGRLAHHLDSLPNALAWPLIAAAVALLAYLVAISAGERPCEQRPGAGVLAAGRPHGESGHERRPARP
ncbi:MAG: hypothetical protein ACHQC8_04195 [Solirubrobacterales bacterium]